ncbi:hypothetical protein [Nocardiopsis composta]|uniref:Uncharacterized protein n=1 Tax=Nocardiopsis composta TaxID=157465 RepID=A0A7W8QPQ8_9ACTN|nr:hypothetical protein [Nocardiopsis composta]MBB5434357.1 hypothetical protein [Nocardiopsis composta]
MSLQRFLATTAVAAAAGAALAITAGPASASEAEVRHDSVQHQSDGFWQELWTWVEENGVVTINRDEFSINTEHGFDEHGNEYSHTSHE